MGRFHSLAPRRLLAVLGTAALGLGAGVATALPASADSATVDGVELRWTMTTEASAGAYIGGCNFLSAGVAGDAGSSRAWTEADGFYSGQEGNVSIQRPVAAGGSEVATWATKCLDANGAAVSPGVSTNSEAVIAGGTGTVDVTAGTATISWDGDVTSAFYGGMSYWTFSDPTLTINANGTGQLVATVAGYAASQSGGTWSAIPAEQIVLADLTGVSVDADGFTVTPAYLGVAVTPASGAQSQTGDYWGAFPQSFVTFQGKTGQGSYWYSSGSSADARKVARPLTVNWTVESTDPGTDGDKHVDVDVSIPEGSGGGTDPEPGAGELTWTVQNAGTRVNLGTAEAGSTAFVASGSLNRVTVTDTRSSAGAWTVNGSATAFSSGSRNFAGSALGWTPALVDNTVGAVAGPTVAAGSGSGLSVASTLVSAPAGHASGAVSVDAALKLSVPLGTAAGSYTSVLTLTVVG